MSSQEVRDNLVARGHFRETMDLREAHLQLRSRGLYIDLEKSPPRTQVWRWMGKIMTAYFGSSDWEDPKIARDYVRFRLGRKGAETFLTELSPIPAFRSADRNWFNWFNKRVPDLKRRLKRREDELFARSRSSLVLCYGLGQADKFARFLRTDWQNVSPEIRRSPDSRYLLLPFFGNGHMRRNVVHELLERGLLRTPKS